MACGDPGGAKRAGTQTASAAGVLALSESFFEPRVAGPQKASLTSLCSPTCTSLRGLPCLGSFSAVQHIRHIGTPHPRVLLYSSGRQAFDGPASLLFSCQCRHVGTEAMVMAPPPTCDSAVSPCFHGCLAFSTGISHHSLLPDIPSICLSLVNSSPHPRIAPQSLNSSSQLLHPLGYLWLRQGLSDSHSI